MDKTIVQFRFSYGLNARGVQNFTARISSIGSYVINIAFIKGIHIIQDR